MGMLEFHGQRYLDGRASDPRELDWMRGAPPAPQKCITVDNGAYDFPQIRWTLSHRRELGPTVNVWRGRGAPSPLERSDKEADIDGLTFTDEKGRTHRFDEALFDAYTDGIVVLHRGRIVYERYFGALEPHLPHECFSVAKSFAGTLAASFVHEGVLDDSKIIAHFLPELRGTAWEDATLRQVMDMQTGLAYSEDYTDERSGDMPYLKYLYALGLRPQPVGYAGPKTMCDYLRTVHKEGAHGDAFAYKSVNTDVMAWVMARVTGRSFAQLLQERLWAPLGCEEDGYLRVDPIGMPVASGALSATLRDLARFGELMRREGDWGGRQVIPASVAREVRHGGDLAKFAKGAPWLPGYSYRSMWWVSHNELNAFEARGLHGQRLYVAPKAEMVVARFASHPLAGANGTEPITGPQLLALGRMLRA